MREAESLERKAKSFADGVPGSAGEAGSSVREANGPVTDAPGLAGGTESAGHEAKSPATGVHRLRSQGSGPRAPGKKSCAQGEQLQPWGFLLRARCPGAAHKAGRVSNARFRGLRATRFALRAGQGTLRPACGHRAQGLKSRNREALSLARRTNNSTIGVFCLAAGVRILARKPWTFARGPRGSAIDIGMRGRRRPCCTAGGCGWLRRRESSDEVPASALARDRRRRCPNSPCSNFL